MASWSIYLIRCADGSLYTGISTDVPRRFAEHESGSRRCAKYLRGRGPLSLVYTQEIGGGRSYASQLEYAVKRLEKGAKEALVRGELRLEDLQG